MPSSKPNRPTCNAARRARDSFSTGPRACSPSCARTASSRNCAWPSAAWQSPPPPPLLLVLVLPPLWGAAAGRLAPV